MILLETRQLSIGYGPVGAETLLVQDISMVLEAGESLSIVGESGAGKTLMALALTGLLPRPLRVLSGEIRFRGKPLILDQRRIWQELLGRELLMLFQSPASALNPMIRIRDQIAEALMDVRACSRAQALKRSASLLEIVGVPLEKADACPFQLSGGMRQRVLIAIALALEPSVLIADEPAVGLDAIHHAAVLGLLRNLNTERNVAMIIITHDLRTASFLSQRAMVLFQGRNVESGSIPDLLGASGHPYTRNLVASLHFLEGYCD